MNERLDSSSQIQQNAVLQRHLLLHPLGLVIGPVKRPSVNKEYLSQIQPYSIFGEIPVLSYTVLMITVCVKVANSTFFVTDKRTKWAELSRYYLCNCFVRLQTRISTAENVKLSCQRRPGLSVSINPSISVQLICTTSCLHKELDIYGLRCFSKKDHRHL